MRLTLPCLAAAALAFGAEIPIDVPKLQPRNVKVEAVNYQGRAATRISDAATSDLPDGSRLAIVTGTDFEDGTIEIDVAGDSLPGVSPVARGFTGIAFRVANDGASYECFYLRPKNGRSEDQAQRNHSTQYESIPEFPWRRLRKETPSVYESYVDLVAGAWTKVKIVVKGKTARLYVNAVEQPALIINELKHGESKCAVALWIDAGTRAHFANLKITK